MVFLLSYYILYPSNQFNFNVETIDRLPITHTQEHRNVFKQESLISCNKIQRLLDHQHLA